MHQDLQQLAERFATDPTPANRDAVVRAALPFIRSIVNRLNVPNHILADQEDLEHIGYIGLLQALDGYNPERSTPFVSYAYGRARGAIVDYLRSIDELPRERRQQLAEAQRAADALSQQLGDDPDDQQVATYLDTSLEEYHHLLHLSQRRYSLSLHAPTNPECDTYVLETISNDDAMENLEAIDRASLHDYVASLVESLPEREQTILGLYYFEELRLREIAQLMDLTEARISQILSKIRDKLRLRLVETQALAA